MMMAIDKDAFDLLKDCHDFFDSWYMETDEVQKEANELHLRLGLLVDAYLFAEECNQSPRKQG